MDGDHFCCTVSQQNLGDLGGNVTDQRVRDTNNVPSEAGGFDI